MESFARRFCRMWRSTKAGVLAEYALVMTCVSVPAYSGAMLVMQKVMDLYASDTTGMQNLALTLYQPADQI